MAAGYYLEISLVRWQLSGELREISGRRIGLETDWYGRCLDADAHPFRKGHPIFNGSFPVKITVRRHSTPSDASLCLLCRLSDSGFSPDVESTDERLHDRQRFSDWYGSPAVRI